MSEGKAIAAVQKAPVQAGGKVAALVPQDIEQAWRMAQMLAESGDMVPKHFQGRPKEIMGAIAKGAEVGLKPMQALHSIAVINGRATLWGDGLRAVLFSAGHHLDCALEGEGEAMRAVATLTRGDSGRSVTRTFSIADAKRAGLWGKAGPWTQYPGRMLSARATAFAARDGAPDALMGLSLPDEAESYGPEAARDVTPRRGGVVYREPEPALPPPAPDEIVEGTFDADRIAAEVRAATDAEVQAEMFGVVK